MTVLLPSTGGRHSQNGIDTGGHGVSRNSGGLFGVPFRGGGSYGQFVHVHPQGTGQGGSQINDAGVVNAGAHVQDRGNLQGFTDCPQSRPGQGCGAEFFEAGLGIGDGGAAGVQDQDIVGNELPGNGGMSKVLTDLGVVAADYTHGAPDLTGLNGVQKWCWCAAQGGKDGFNGKAAHLVNRRDRNERPFRTCGWRNFPRPI